MCLIVCYLATSTVRRSRPEFGYCATEINNRRGIYKTSAMFKITVISNTTPFLLIKVYTIMLYTTVQESVEENITTVYEGWWRDLTALQVQWYHQSPALFKRADLGWKTAYRTRITPLIPLTKEYRVLMRKPEGRRPLGRHRRRHDSYIKVYHIEMGWEGMDWIHLAQGTDKLQAVMKTVMNFWMS